VDAFLTNLSDIPVDLYRTAGGKWTVGQISRPRPARIVLPERMMTVHRTLGGSYFRQATPRRFSMRILTTAGLLLAFLLAGCSAPSSSGSSMSMKADPANYHASSFGEQNNEPFQGVYPGH